MAEQREQRCENCRFWKPLFDDGSGDTGWCKRNPPSLFMFPDTELVGEEDINSGHWPTTVQYEWCGEWQPAAETPVKRCPPLLSTYEAKDLLNATTAQIRKWVKSGILPIVQLPYGDFRFLESDLAEWIEKHRQPAADESRP